MIEILDNYDYSLWRNAMNSEMYLLELKSIQKQFEQKFNFYWNEFVLKCDKRLAEARQLNIGNHTRPFLVYLGYAANAGFNNSSAIEKTAQLAVSIEAVHKASIIIDDIIDGDTLRRGEKCMHDQFGEYETVFFAVCMLANGVENVNKMLSFDKTETLHTSIISILCNTIYSMCNGAIKELSLDAQNITNLEYIQDIIDAETVKLIENSLYIGYLCSGETNEIASKTIRNIGRKCGYIFQVMNDLEVFCNPDYILAYKGNINSDFLRSRKSIILPYLYKACNMSDKRALMEMLGKDVTSFGETKRLFEQYDIKSAILKDVCVIYDSLFEILSSLPNDIYNKRWIEIFTAYIKYTKNKYQALLNTS